MKDRFLITSVDTQLGTAGAAPVVAPDIPSAPVSPADHLVVPIVLPRPSRWARYARLASTIVVMGGHLGPPIVRRILRRPVEPKVVAHPLPVSFQGLGPTSVK